MTPGSPTDGAPAWRTIQRGLSAGQVLVVKVSSQYAVQWLDLRLKRLILRTPQGLVGSSIGVRFQTDRRNTTP